MLLDAFLPIGDFSEVHAIVIHAPPSRIFQAMKTVTVAELPMFRLLFGLRMLPARLRGPGRRTFARQQPLFDWAQRMGLILAEKTDQELVFGLIGQFWRLAGGRRVQIRTAQDFRVFQQADYAKAATNFFLEPTEHGRSIRLRTETRIQTFGPGARKKFGWYWKLIHPGSALIRREWLWAIKRRAEQPEAGNGESSGSVR
jgi:hypothetical protein